MNDYSIVKSNNKNLYNILTIEQLLNYNKVMSEIVTKLKPLLPDTTLLYELSDFFKIMGDGTRIQLLWALEESEMCVNDLASLLNMTKSAVSHQLKVLRVAKLVKAQKKGKNVYYSLSDNHVKTIFQMALEHICE
ncbi:putative transcriptional regulator [Brachyspira sp. CAG:484]|nr:putative transcriptional regulator [Brachyspira sp. CAG:484]